MVIKQNIYQPGKGWDMPSAEGIEGLADLGIVFGAKAHLLNQSLMDDLRVKFPSKHYTGGSTSGEIAGSNVFDDSLIITRVWFSKVRIEQCEITLQDVSSSYSYGEQLVKMFQPEGLRHIFVLSEGVNINGSQLVLGMRTFAPEGVSITGGLSGDGTNFQETVVLNGKGQPHKNLINAIGFYGDALSIGFASFGGWDSFGIERTVTRSHENVLYELDGQPALELYKSFLGELQNQLPASALLFPLSLRYSADHPPVVRTILGMDEDQQSLRFAGDIPEGSSVRLMKANIDRLIDGAVHAAEKSFKTIGEITPDLTILISCVGRKLVLKQMVEEEVEGVRDIMGTETATTGFYSYGEISPFTADSRCELHNQTMTITAFRER